MSNLSLRRDQLVLALSTLTDKREPTVSRATVVLGPVLWIVHRSELVIVVGPQEGSASGRGSVSFFVHDKAKRVEEECPLSRLPPFHPDAVEASVWQTLPHQIVSLAWLIMRPEHKPTEAARQLRNTVGKMIDKLEKEKLDDAGE